MNLHSTHLLLLAAAIACGCARAPRRPNVLLVTLDTTRADHIGCYAPHTGYTPSIDSLARDGTVFENVSTTCPLTLPAHATILTGLTPLAHGVRVNDAGGLDPSIPTLPALFQTNGYDTAAFVSSVVLDHGFGLSGGFDTYCDDMPARVLSSIEEDRDERRAAAWPSIDGAVTTGRFLDWLSNHSRPWFAWVHYYDPHGPYEPHPEFEKSGATDAYSQEISYADSQLGRIVAKLKDSGQYRDTWIVVLADHGEGLGDHGESFHGLLAYDTTIRVPLVVKPACGSGWKLPRRVPSLASSADVAPTLALAVFGEKWSSESHEAAGRPLQSLAGDTATRTAYFETIYPEVAHGWAPLAGLRRDSWKYIESARPELFDTAADPAETDDRIEPDDDIAEDLAHSLDFIRSQPSSPATQSPGEAASSLCHAPSSEGEAASPLGATSLRGRAPAPSSAMLARLRSLGYTAGGDSAQRVAATRAARPGDSRIDVKDALPLAAESARMAGAFERGEVDAAASLPRIRELAALLPGHLKTQFLLASALERAGEIAEAESLLSSIADSHPEESSPREALGSFFLRRGRDREARAMFEDALELGGGPELQPLIDLRLSHLDFLEGDFASATNRISRALPFLGKRRDALKRLGDALLCLGDAPAAIDAYDQALAELPGWPPALEGRAWAAIAHGDSELRKQALRDAYTLRLLSDGREPRDLETLAATYAANGMADKAAETARLAIAIARGLAQLPPPPPGYAALLKRSGAQAQDSRSRYFGIIAERLEAVVKEWESGPGPGSSYAVKRISSPEYLLDTPVRQAKSRDY